MVVIQLWEMNALTSSSSRTSCNEGSSAVVRAAPKSASLDALNSPMCCKATEFDQNIKNDPIRNCRRDWKFAKLFDRVFRSTNLDEQLNVLFVQRIEANQIFHCRHNFHHCCLDYILIAVVWLVLHQSDIHVRSTPQQFIPIHFQT